MAWPQNEPFTQHSNLSYSYFDLLFIEDIRIISLNFIVVTHRANHEQLTTIRSNQNFCLIKPAVYGKISIFRQFLNLLGRLKRIILNFVQLKKILPTNRNNVRLSGTDC